MRYLRLTPKTKSEALSFNLGPTDARLAKLSLITLTKALPTITPSAKAAT